MRRIVGVLILAALPLCAGPAADLARAIRENGLNRDECYRVRDLTIVREDVRIYLSDGYLIFSKPVAGQPIAAVFTTDVESGDGEVLVLPPNLAERRALVSYIGTPNLDEHFQSAVFFFTGPVYQELMAQLPQNPTNRKVPEMGALLDEKWTPVLREIGAGIDIRLSLDLLNGASRKPDLLSAILQSNKLGSFDVLYDPDSQNQIAAGRLTLRNNQAFFDVWTYFPSRSARGGAGPRRIDVDLSDYRIEAAVNPDLSLSGVTRVKVKTATDGIAAVPFEIAHPMAVTAASVDGKPAEVFQRQAEPGDPARADNDLFLVVPPEPLRAGREYEFEFHHAGKVILNAGDRIFYVTARGNWYPSRGLQASTFDLTFRYPRDLELVTPGEVVEDRVDGDWRITRRRTRTPIGIAGFNLGNYAHAKVTRGAYVVDVCANRALEPGLQPKLPPPNPSPPVPLGRRNNRPPFDIALPNIPTTDPLARLRTLANDVASALEFMASKFGPPTVPQLTVSPIPGTFGQGFPGLIYLSTRSYVNPAETSMPPADALFYDELLQAHETAHQWWGGIVYSASYRDDWLMEALANYSALLYLEKRKGTHEVETLLDGYRATLLEKSDNGQNTDATGPIVMGTRLESSLDPRAWHAITYGKGSWILQMLRQRMGDERFFSMLAEVIHRFDRRRISTEDFRAVAAQFLPPKSDDPKLESFFDQWVYGTGIPTLKFTYTLKGRAPALKLVGKLTQSDVDDNFSVLAPIEIQLGRGQNITRWVRSSDEPATFTVDLKQAPLKVTLDPHYGVLRR